MKNFLHFSIYFLAPKIPFIQGEFIQSTERESTTPDRYIVCIVEKFNANGKQQHKISWKSRNIAAPNRGSIKTLKVKHSGK